jgi:hypothetical protein
MPNALSILAELADVGLPAEKLESEIASNPEVRSAVIAKAKEVERAWKSLAPVDESGRGPHDIYGIEQRPGEYRDSIRTSYHTDKEAGAFTAKVGTNDKPLCRWLEYGSVHNPEFGYGQRVANQFGAEVIPPGKSSVLK